ncbi:pyridoxamine 5'-phosphate oxidase family protein [Aquisediminimonas profunda]|uniref:pyridoxamine 5'-phosphate oxidase family protein n=1 Tax=Aquisediminimonas profunda TaxID=1550733 RepID=UPI001C63889E|nr:pyridoxamine 5'-phosphate oxidase family protein [Aquisediminimonas profunda]
MNDSASADLEQRLWNELAPSAFAFVGLLNDDASDVPMTVHRDGQDHTSLWIFTTPHCRLSDEGLAVAHYMNKSQDLFARILGTIRAEHDEALIDRLWSPHIAAWYDGGRDDRDLAVLRLDIDHSEIWNAATSPLTMINRPAAAKAEDARQGHHAIVSTR